jgi:hypothetical protein
MADSMTWNDSLVRRFDSSDGRHAVIIEVDPRVAYAYLLDGEDIVGDVWLYNVAHTPERVDWRDREQMPFLNPYNYCSSEKVPNLREDMQCHWHGESAEIHSAGRVVARLEPGAKPGWSSMAAKDGPLAKKLERVG